jgi:polyferredoxin
MDWFFRLPLAAPFAIVVGGFVVGTLVGIMAAFVGLVVFVTVALDHPFQGAVTPSENGFRLIAERPFGGQ